MDDYNYSPQGTVAEAAAADRVTFIRRTYLHLAVAILAFAGVETFLLTSPWAISIARGMLSAWWMVLLAFMGVSWLANRWAVSSTSKGLQYLGLGTYVVIEAFIFLPILLVASGMEGGQYVIQSAGIMTLLLVGGITATVFLTRKDFSFMGGILGIGSFVVLGLIACSFFVPQLQLGTWFSVAMIAFAGGSILYTTSNILHQYRTDQHVAASLALFAGVMLLFFYILRLLMSRR